MYRKLATHNFVEHTVHTEWDINRSNGSVACCLKAQLDRAVRDKEACRREGIKEKYCTDTKRRVPKIRRGV